MTSVRSARTSKETCGCSATSRSESDGSGLNVPLDPDDDVVRDLDEIWELPDTAVKPEGIAALGDGRVLVALDTRSTSGNGLIVTRPP